MLILSTKIKNNILDNRITTLATCLRIELEDGRRIAFTTNVKNVKFLEDPQLVYNNTGFTPTATSKNSALAVDNSEGTLIIDSDLITESDLETGVYNNAKFFTFYFDYSLKENGFYSYADIIKGDSGTIGEITRGGGEYKTEFRGLTQPLTTTVGDVYKFSCVVEFTGTKCGLNPLTYTKISKITQVLKSSKFLIQDDLNEFTDGQFNNGIITFTTGQNKGKKYSIKSYESATKTLTLQLPTNFPVVELDEITLLQGCNKSKKACQDYSNIVNFRGFPNIPGTDFIASGGGITVKYGSE